MQIQINTDHNIHGTEQLATQVKRVVSDTLSRFSDQITRVEVHLSDQNGNKRGQSRKRCMMEVRHEHRYPTIVTHDATSLRQAIDGAADKLKRLIKSTLGRQHAFR